MKLATFMKINESSLWNITYTSSKERKRQVLKGTSHRVEHARESEPYRMELSKSTNKLLHIVIRKKLITSVSVYLH